MFLLAIPTVLAADPIRYVLLAPGAALGKAPQKQAESVPTSSHVRGTTLHMIRRDGDWIQVEATSGSDSGVLCSPTDGYLEWTPRPRGPVRGWTKRPPGWTLTMGGPEVKVEGTASLGATMRVVEGVQAPRPPTPAGGPPR